MVLVAAGGLGYFSWRRHAAVSAAVETAYVLPESLGVVDSPAEIRLGVAMLRHGDRVEVLGRTRNWSKIRVADGRVGWVETASLLDSASYEKGQRLFLELQREQPQAVGHTVNVANLRVEPARDAVQLMQLRAGQSLEIFGRRMVERLAPPGAPPSSEPLRDAWYLVRVGEKAGWMLGRLVALDLPEAIAHYAQSANLVACVVVSTVEDKGRRVPQYLVADRVGTTEYDFTHIRIFTWWVKKQEYVTAYVESNLRGYFPLRVSQVDGVPHFRLRLVDPKGRKFQKVYRMVDTIARPVGIVEGWESQAMPERPAVPSRPAARRPRR